jgi:hypothetical protein
MPWPVRCFSIGMDGFRIVFMPNNSDVRKDSIWSLQLSFSGEEKWGKEGEVLFPKRKPERTSEKS